MIGLNNKSMEERVNKLLKDYLFGAGLFLIGVAGTLVTLTLVVFEIVEPSLSLLAYPVIVVIGADNIISLWKKE